jgi:hypothetical protein
MTAGKRLKKKTKTKAWTLPTVLGLALSLLAAWELTPQISVDPLEAKEPSQPFSAPFRIENDGYFSFWIKHVVCYTHALKAGNISEAEGVSFPVSPTSDGKLDHLILEGHEGETATCNVLYGPRVEYADIAIVIDYSPWKSFPMTFRTCRRFTGDYGGNWQWLKQPCGPIRPNADTEVDKLLLRFYGQTE